MVKILIDSASDYDEKEASENGIYLMPVEVRFGEESFFDGINLTHREFFEKLIESSELPKTSQINEYRWQEAYKKYTEGGDELVVITLSSKLSGTYNSAVSAAKGFSGKVFVVDSLSATAGERILCEYALKLIAENKTAAEVADELNREKSKIQVMAVVDTLKYLRKGGRISAAVAFTGEILSIKPVVSVVGGEVKLVGKAMGSKKSNNLLVQLIQKCGGIDFSRPFELMYSGLSDEYLKKYLHDSEALWKDEISDVSKIPTCLIGSTIGTHVGPNAVGLAFFAKYKENDNGKK